MLGSPRRPPPVPPLPHLDHGSDHDSAHDYDHHRGAVGRPSPSSSHFHFPLPILRNVTSEVEVEVHPAAPSLPGSTAPASAPAVGFGRDGKPVSPAARGQGVSGTRDEKGRVKC